MSLDVWLTVEETHKVKSKIYIREDGQTKAITIDEWNERFPDREPVVTESTNTHEVYEANITHNLNTMAKKAGLYFYLWKPEEVGIEQAHELIIPLQYGLGWLKSAPYYFRQFNPFNGWGNYEGLVRFVEDYLEACKKYPQAKVEVSR